MLQKIIIMLKKIKIMFKKTLIKIRIKTKKRKTLNSKMKIKE